MRYYIISGEASGDLHGSNLIKALKKKDPGAEIRCWGGDKMEAEGATLVKHYKELAFMGFWEVIKNLRTILKNIKYCKEDILQYQPQALILIDYPGFNLRIAKWAKEQGIFTLSKGKVIYYISPQVWAWKENRVKLIKNCVDKMLVILPFEKEFYAKWNYEVEYVGHPLVEVIDRFSSLVERDGLQVSQSLLNDANEKRETKNEKQKTTNEKQETTNKKQETTNKKQETTNEKQETAIIALLPGSRQQEILKKLPIMLQVSAHFPDYHFVVAKAPGLDDSFYTTLLAPYKNVSSVADKTYELLVQSKAALVTSGTATLETALFAVPEVICYKGSMFSYQIAKRLIKIKFIGLVNLIMDKEVVKELIQDELTVENLKHELGLLLHDEKKQQQLKEDYTALKVLLSKGGHASANAASSIVSCLAGLPQ